MGKHEDKVHNGNPNEQDKVDIGMPDVDTTNGDDNIKVSYVPNSQESETTLGDQEPPHLQVLRKGT